MELSRSQQILLETIHTHNCEWNDYKTGRPCLSQPTLWGESRTVGEYLGAVVAVSPERGGGWVIYSELQAIAELTVSIDMHYTSNLDHVVRERLAKLRISDDIITGLIDKVGASGMANGLSPEQAESMEGVILEQNLHARYSSAYLSLPFTDSNGNRHRATYRYVSPGLFTRGFYYRLVQITSDDGGDQANIHQKRE
jgi:hypothetical protein